MISEVHGILHDTEMGTSLAQQLSAGHKFLKWNDIPDSLQGNDLQSLFVPSEICMQVQI